MQRIISDLINNKLIYKYHKCLYIIYGIFILIILYFIEDNHYSYKPKPKCENEIIIKKRLNISNHLSNIYSELFDYTRKNSYKPKFSNIIKDYSSKKKKNGICICSIAKKENLYIREYIDHYFRLGVDKIFIFDNNDIEDANIETNLTDYIKNKFVEIIDIRGLTAAQIPIYNYCYRINKNKYDWIGFLDIDEYLYIEDNKSINNYLNEDSFNKCQSIFFNWIMYNDNDLVRYESKKIKDRFTKAIANSNEGKSFVRGNIDNLLIPTTHIIGININNFCNSNGEFIYPNNFMDYKFKTNPKAYIKHYYTKTAEEFCNKLTKGHAHFHKHHPEYIGTIKFRIQYFFKLNKKTEEKINILEKCTGIKIEN